MDERLNEINRELKELNEALARQGRMEAQWIIPLRPSIVF